MPTPYKRHLGPSGPAIVSHAPFCPGFRPGFKPSLCELVEDLLVLCESSHTTLDARILVLEFLERIGALASHSYYMLQKKALLGYEIRLLKFVFWPI